MATLFDAWQDALTNQYLFEGNPFDDPTYGARRMRMVIRNTHRFLENQQPRKLPVLRSYTTPPREFKRPVGHDANEPYPIPPIGLIHDRPDVEALSLRQVTNIQQQNVQTGTYAEWQGNFRQYGATIDLQTVLAPDSDPLVLRFTGLPSLVGLTDSRLRNAASADALRTITDELLPIMSLESEVYQLALEYHILEHLKDERAVERYQELVSTIDNKRPGVQLVRVISTTPQGTDDTLAASFIPSP